MSRIFLYATHRTLVRYDSYAFEKLGHITHAVTNVTNNLNLKPHELQAIAKINTDVHVRQKISPKTLKILLDNFDILYVSQMPTWLMSCAEDFLKAGKQVIFRVFGGKWAPGGQFFSQKHKFIRDQILALKGLGNFDLMSVYGRVSKEWGQNIEFAFTIKEGWANQQNFPIIREPRAIITQSLAGCGYIKSVKNCEILNRGSGRLSQDVYSKFLTTASLYVDPFIHRNVARFIPFEAIMLGLPLVAHQNTVFRKIMSDTGFTTDLKWTFDDFATANQLIQSYLPFSEKSQRLLNEQQIHAKKLIEESYIKWAKMLKRVPS